MVDLPPKNPNKRPVPQNEMEENNPHLNEENDDFVNLCHEWQVRPEVLEKYLHNFTEDQLDMFVGWSTSKKPEERVMAREALGVPPDLKDLELVQNSKKERQRDLARFLGVSVSVLTALVATSTENEREEAEKEFVWLNERPHGEGETPKPQNNRRDMESMRLLTVANAVASDIPSEPTPKGPGKKKLSYSDPVPTD